MHGQRRKEQRETGIAAVGDRQPRRYREPGRADRNKCIGNPLCSRRSPSWHRASGSEHLPQHHPHDRPPGTIEEDHVEIGRNQGDDALVARQRDATTRLRHRRRKRPAKTASVTAMPIDPVRSRGLRPIRSMQAIVPRQAATDGISDRMLILTASLSHDLQFGPVERHLRRCHVTRRADEPRRRRGRNRHLVDRENRRSEPHGLATLQD